MAFRATQVVLGPPVQMPLTQAESGLGLATEDALVHSLPPVVYDVVVEQAKGVIK